MNMVMKLAVAGLAIGLSFSPPAKSQGIPTAEVRAITKEAYIFGLPHVDDYRILYSYFVNRQDSEYKGDWNRIHHITRLYGPEDKAIQTINSDTLYSFVGLDLRAEPVVLTMPAIDKARYYSIQLIDPQGFNFDYIGSRTTGNDEGSYLIAGPGWNGETPKGVKKVIRTEALLATAAYRTQLFNPEDLENVKKVQAGYKVQTLSEYLGTPKPQAPPVDFLKPLTREQQKSSLEFFNVLNFFLQFTPTHPSERELMARLSRIGVESGKPFDVAKLSPETKAAMEQGVADAWLDINATIKKINTGEVSVNDLPGSREYLKNNYLYRATGIELGGNGHSKEEAIYIFFNLDADGKPFNGSNRYTIQFAADKMPPANQFWSLTMYDLPGRLLVANPINRYLLNTPMQAKWVKDADGGLTFYIQNESPGKDKEANWLPAPKGPFYMVMRLYLPKPEALDGRWQTPKAVAVK